MIIPRWAYSPLHWLRYSIAPLKCFVCNDPVKAAFICPQCQGEIHFLPSAHCEQCAEPFTATELSSHLCGECLSNPPSFQKVFSPFVFDGAIEKLLKGLKFGRQAWNATVLADLAKDHFSQAIDQFQPDALLPMPLWWWRQMRRGYNQSYVLAWSLCRSAGVSLPLLLTVRRRRHPPQARRTRKERRRLLPVVFQVKEESSLKGKRILLIDDIVTTGASSHALAKCAFKAGAAAVSVFAFARAVRVKKNPKIEVTS